MTKSSQYVPVLVALTLALIGISLLSGEAEVLGNPVSDSEAALYYGGQSQNCLPYKAYKCNAGTNCNTTIEVYKTLQGQTLTASTADSVWCGTTGNCGGFFNNLKGCNTGK